MQIFMSILHCHTKYPRKTKYIPKSKHINNLYANSSATYTSAWKQAVCRISACAWKKEYKVSRRNNGEPTAGKLK